jgi:hypothetical protein
MPPRTSSLGSHTFGFRQANLLLWHGSVRLYPASGCALVRLAFPFDPPTVYDDGVLLDDAHNAALTPRFFPTRLSARLLRLLPARLFRLFAQCVLLSAPFTTTNPSQTPIVLRASFRSDSIRATRLEASPSSLEPRKCHTSLKWARPFRKQRKFLRDHLCRESGGTRRPSPLR